MHCFSYGCCLPLVRFDESRVFCFLLWLSGRPYVDIRHMKDAFLPLSVSYGEHSILKTCHRWHVVPHMLADTYRTETSGQKLIGKLGGIVTRARAGSLSDSKTVATNDLDRASHQPRRYARSFLRFATARVCPCLFVHRTCWPL